MVKYVRDGEDNISWLDKGKLILFFFTVGFTLFQQLTDEYWKICLSLLGIWGVENVPDIILHRPRFDSIIWLKQSTTYLYFEHTLIIIKSSS